MSSLETLAKELILELEREDHQGKESLKHKSTGLANALHKFLQKRRKKEWEEQVEEEKLPL